jgi:DNA polymerase-3 subunit beta
MKFSILKEIIQEKLSFASQFCLSKTSTISSLQGAMIKINKNKMEIITTNLNDFFYTQVKIDSKEKKEIVVDIKKIVEFLSFLPQGKIEIEIQEKKIIIKNDKTQGSFSLLPSADFPSLPKIEGKSFYLSQDFFNKILPMVLFAAAKDESRPVLTGINFLTRENKTYIVATDGFRLSLFTKEKDEKIPPMVVSANLLNQINKLIKDSQKKEIELIFSDENKIIQIGLGDNQTFILSRVIEGEFPPFEKVVPTGYKTRLSLDKEELLRNIKLVSVFARDLSNIVFFEIKEDGLYLKPKIKEKEGTVVYQEGRMEGEEQTIAFNYKFILDFLVNVEGKEVFFEMGQPNTPAVFKSDQHKNLLHIIMPIRTEEETS